MSFEAVPCMFRTGTGGESENGFLGLWIRPAVTPATNCPQQVAPPTISATIVTPPSSQKALHVVSLPVTRSVQEPKMVVQNGIQVRVQHATSNLVSNPQFTNVWQQQQRTDTVVGVQSVQQSSQVISLATTNETFNCNSNPSTSTSNFFPPISSITSFSSRKSDIDLLQEASANNLSMVDQTSKHGVTMNEFESRYQTNIQPPNFSAPMRIDMTNGHVLDNQYQNNFGQRAPPCSVSPDSGIQSIDGSPPSARTFTPSIHSPAPYISESNVERSESEKGETEHCSDFSDMPRLTAYNLSAPSSPGNVQIITREGEKDELRENVETEEKKDVKEMPESIPPEFKEKKSENEVAKDEDKLNFALNSDLNVSELVDHILSLAKPEQIQQICSVFQTKVRNDTQNADLAEKSVPEDNTESSNEEQIGFKDNPRNVDIIDDPNTLETEEERNRDDCLLTDEEVNKYEADVELPENFGIINSGVGRIEDEDGSSMIVIDEGIVELKDFENKKEIELESTDIHAIPEQCIKNKFEKETMESNIEVAKEAKKAESIDHCPETCLINFSKEKILEHRRNVRARFGQQVEHMIENITEQMNRTNFNLGRSLIQPDLRPWLSIDWNSIERRAKERKKRKQEREKRKDSLEKRVISKKKKFCNIVDNKQNLVNKASTSSASASDPARSTLSYVTIKRNIIVDDCALMSMEDFSSVNPCALNGCVPSIGRVSSVGSERNTEASDLHSKVRFQKFRRLDGRGYGLKALTKVDEGKFITEYFGEIINVETHQQRHRSFYHKRLKTFAMDLAAPGFVLDASFKGCTARFINNSCRPNCTFKRWSTDGRYHVGIFALRSIEKDEELTVKYDCDYRIVGRCWCGLSGCCGLMRNRPLLTNNENELVKRSRLLLSRNLRKVLNTRSKYSGKADEPIYLDAPGPSKEGKILNVPRFIESTRKLLTDMKVCSPRQLNALNIYMDKLLRQKCSSNEIPLLIENKIDQMLDKQKDDKKCARQKKAELWKIAYIDLRQKFLSNADKKKGPIKRSKSRSEKLLSTKVDYSYLDHSVLVGSYDPDVIDHSLKANDEKESVRCICVYYEEDNSMIKCDNCKYWLHQICVFSDGNFPNNEQAYLCEICALKLKRHPTISVILSPKPEFRWKDCTYYRTLVNSRNIQVCVGEAVYVLLPKDYSYKKEFKSLEKISEEPSRSPSPLQVHPVAKSYLPFQKNEFHRGDVLFFRVTRLFELQNGNKFAFGCFYKRPHEIFCEPGRLFHKKELFTSDMYDTLPFDSIVGRCLILSPEVYCEGRPKYPKYDESDVYFSEYMSKGKKFKKLNPSDHLAIRSDDPCMFTRFPEKIEIVRDFTPFIMVDRPKIQSVKGDNSSFRGKSGSLSQTKKSGTETQCKKLKPKTCSFILESIVSIIKHEKEEIPKKDQAVSKRKRFEPSTCDSTRKKGGKRKLCESSSTSEKKSRLF